MVAPAAAAAAAVVAPACVRACVRACIRPRLRPCVRTCVYVHARACVRACEQASDRACVGVQVPAAVVAPAATAAVLTAWRLWSLACHNYIGHNHIVMAHGLETLEPRLPRPRIGPIKLS